MMSKTVKGFFVGKRPWSIIKDRVLESYMTPYIAKVSSLGRRILLIDGYAGPGVFEDGKYGSPMIICQAAENYAKGNWEALFINNEQKYHNKLTQLIQREGWSRSAKTLLGDSTVLLQTLPQTLKDQSVFLYLDPFGPTGCEFALLRPFLERNHRYSTEIILTMNMPGMPRLAARHATKVGRQEEQAIKYNHLLLNRIFGGEYWKDILLQQDGSTEEREFRLIEAYRAKLAEYLPYTGFCPVRDRIDRQIKYFIVFASRHKDTLTLLNDAMVKAYFLRMHEASFGNGIWKEADWREMRSTDWREAQYFHQLDRVIIETVTEHPGETREDIWFRIVQEYFMRYLESEYKTTLQRLVDEKKLLSPTKRPTKRLNNNCALYPNQA
jgi:three-Cys-motif partner protein